MARYIFLTAQESVAPSLHLISHTTFIFLPGIKIDSFFIVQFYISQLTLSKPTNNSSKHLSIYFLSS